MAGESYGTRPDLLPRAIRESMRHDGSPTRLLAWEENRAYEADSLNRLPAVGSARLDWSGVAGASRDVYADEPEAVHLLERILLTVGSPGDVLVIFSDNLLVPTVVTEVGLAVTFLRDVVDEYLDFWLFLPGERRLLECRMDGDVLHGLIPPQDEAPDGGV